MNAWDIIILIIVGLILILAFKQASSRSKKGGCSCGCENCPSNTSGQCQKKENNSGKESAGEK